MHETRAWIAALLIGCSGSGGAGAPSDSGSMDSTSSAAEAGRDGPGEAARHDAAAGQESGRDTSSGYPAPHPPMPQERDLGGPVMKSPKFFILTFVGDPLAGAIDDFADKVAASSTYWSGTTAEYGVGRVAKVWHVSVNEKPKADLLDDDVQTWLTDKLSGPEAGTLEAGAPWPRPDGETVYMIYYPMTSAIDSVTSIASHELIEATTDPLVQDNPAWAQPDLDHLAWAIPAGGELGDMCAGFGDVFYKPSDVPYLVQRSWSNKAAAAGHDPCQPDGAKPYFNSAAVLTQSVTVSGAGSFTTKGIHIPVGGTGTVELDLYSDAPTSGPWTIQAFDFSSLFGGPMELETSFGGKAMGTGENGDKVSLDLKVRQRGQGGVELLWIQSTLGSTESVWLGLVGSD
jgi:hypothetical protein